MKKSNITRRKFITTSSLVTAGTIISKGAGPLVLDNGSVLQMGLPSELEPWYDRTMRWMQIIFTEGDTSRYDPQWWLDLFKRAHVDGLCLVAGGVTAFYPTKIPFHPRAKLMKEGQDMFGEIVRPAQEMGITIVARTDSQACLNEAAAIHPEWINIDENGNPRKHKSFLDTRTVTCGMGDYNFKYMTSIHREIMENYMVDGLFVNRWQAWARGMCYCDTCQRLFKDFSRGMELPRKHSQKEQLLKYAEWETERLTELWQLWDGEIRKINPKARYFSNIGIDIDRAAVLSPTYISEVQSRGNHQPWQVGYQGKRMQAVFGPTKKIIALNGMTLDSRHSVVPEAELKMWLLGSTVNGLSPWLLKSSATNWDNRWIPAFEKVFSWHFTNEKYLKNEENLAKVAILFRKDNPRNPLLGTGASIAVGGDRDIDPEGRRLYPDVPVNDNNCTSGIYQALIESRIPFDMAYNQKIEEEHLDRYKVIILPNLSNLTDEECQKIREYVNRGGSIVATFETSLYDNGKARPDFGLSELIGVKYGGKTESNGPNGYIRLEHETNHPILKGLEEAQQIVSTQRYANVQAFASFAQPPLTKIPSYPTDPMEHIFPTVRKTDISEVYMRTINNRSRVVYFPGDIGATFANNMAPDLATIFKNAIEWAMNGIPQPVAVSGPGILEVTCWKQAKSMTVHMLNCTNPFMLRSAYREEIPVGAQNVTIQIPDGLTVGDVKLLVADVKPVFNLKGRELSLLIESIVDHEAVAIDFV